METTTADASAGAGEAVQVQGKQPSMQVEERKKMKVMVAIDESDESFYALKWALDNLLNSMRVTAEPNQDSGMVTLVHVQQPFQHFIYPAGPAVYATSTVLESVRKAQEQNSALILSRALQMCTEKMVAVASARSRGDPLTSLSLRVAYRLIYCIRLQRCIKVKLRTSNPQGILRKCK